MRPRRVALLIGVTVLGVGCSDAPEPTPSLRGSWTLVTATVDGVEYQPNPSTTTLVSKTERGGQAISGCEVATLRIESGPGRVEIDAVEPGTMMSCLPGTVDSLHGQYFIALERVEAASADESSLKLTGPEVELRFTHLD